LAKKVTEQDVWLQLAEGMQNIGLAPNIKRYRPHAKQELFHESRAKQKLYIGGNRSGKTTGGVCEDIWRCLKRHPYRPDLNSIPGPVRGRVVAVSLTEGVEKILFPQFKQWLYPSAMRGGAWETAYDKQLRTLYFENGSEIEFMSYDQDLPKFAGTSRHFIHFDEEPPKSIYEECRARLIDTNGDFWITETPTEGMTWVHEDLYEPNVGVENAPVLVIEVNTLENPYLGSEALAEFAKGTDKESMATRIAGQFVQKGGRIYKRFDPTVGGLHVLDSPILEPQVTFNRWHWIQGFDHGLNNPAAALWAAVDPNGFIVVFAEHYRKDWSVKQHAAEISKIERGWNRLPDLRVADPSIKNRNAVSMTSIQEEYARAGIGFTLGNNDVKAGLVRVMRYFDTVKLVGQQSPFIEQLAKEKNVKELPRVLVSPSCVNFINEHKKYRWATYLHKKQQFENNPKDEPHKKDDHTCDAFRYLVMTRPDLKADNPDIKGKVEAAMAEMEDGMKISSSASPLGRVDDPNGRLNTGWEFGDNPHTKADNAWSFDEHMGGTF
jgi:phage terminase large subunit-like protein